jgi:hypothetical protein
MSIFNAGKNGISNAKDNHDELKKVQSIVKRGMITKNRNRFRPVNVEARRLKTN